MQYNIQVHERVAVCRTDSYVEEENIGEMKLPFATHYIWRNKKYKLNYAIHSQLIIRK